MGYDLEGDYRSGFGNSRRGRRECDELVRSMTGFNHFEGRPHRRE